MTNQTTFFLRVMRRLAVSLVLIAFPAQSFAQTAEPERETLLNGLRILYWQQPGNPNVLLRLRIHSGAAFDLAGKAGMMALFSDALFPDRATREYVADELGGKLEVTTTFDSIDVTLSGKQSALERMIDLLRGAVLTTPLDADTVSRLRAARIASLSISSSAAAKADQSIADRLFGTFPYAHPPEGTAATMAKVDRGDLLLARERFLNADNASLVVMGGVEKPRLMRALRQLLGPWGKSNVNVPATFRQPTAPDSRVFLVDTPGAARAEVRLAVRGLSRSDPDSLAADMLAAIVRQRWQDAVPELSNASVQHRAYLLPGIFVFSGSVPTASASKAIAAAQTIMRSASQTAPTEGEVREARAEILSRNTKEISQPEGLAKMWLDVDTFKLSRRPNAIAGFVSAIEASDIQRVAARLLKDQPVATVVVGNSEELKSAFAGKLDTGAAASGPAVQIKKP